MRRPTLLRSFKSLLGIKSLTSRARYIKLGTVGCKKETFFKV